MSYAVCCVAVSPIRVEPSHLSEMVTQQLFGEPCEIIDRVKDHWIKIRSQYDNMEGWCQDSQVTEIEPKDYDKKTKALTSDWVSDLEYNGHVMKVPMGCSLTAMKNGRATWLKNHTYFKGNVWQPASATRDTKNIKLIAFKFFNTPYLWGGKSVFGIDCSGFTQSVYKFFNYPLPRDAWQQAEKGEVVGFLQEARCGDLAFFDDPDGRIIHTGILLNDFEIIHAAGKVRVDKIDVHGIVNSENFQRTHQLRIIKRYF